MRRFSLLVALAATSSFCMAQSDSLSLQEVVVTGTRNATDVRHLPYTVTVIERDRLEQGHQLSLLPTLTQYVPGLMTTSRAMMGYGVSGGSSGMLNMRGISSATPESGAGQMMVLIDGHPHYQGLFGHTIADSYQTLMAERVEVLRGPASVLYGSNAMGGVINIVTRNVQRDTVATNITLGAGSFGTIQAEASNQVRCGGFSSTVALQYGRSDNHRPSMGFEQFGGYAKLGYDFSSHWKASADLDLTRFIASYPGSTISPIEDAKQWITRGIASVAVDNHYDKTDGRLSLYYTFGNHKINDGHDPKKTPAVNFFRSEDALMGVTWYQSARLFKGNRVTVGVDYQHIYGKAWNQVIETGEDKDPLANDRENEVAGYVDFRQDVLSWLTLDAGIRLDHHSRTGTEWVPQGGIVVRPFHSAEVKATVSKGFRNPTIREMYLFKMKNDELRPERLWNYELSWRHRLMDNQLQYGVNLYYIKGDNIILLMPVGKSSRFMNSGDIENYGVEVEAQYNIDRHWALTTNHSYLHMKNPVVAAPTYKGFLGANFHMGKWSAVAGVQYINGLYTDVGKNETKESFCLVNASVNYQLLKCLALWVRGENLLAQSYEINKGYPMPRATVMGGVNVSF